MSGISQFHNHITGKANNKDIITKTIITDVIPTNTFIF